MWNIQSFFDEPSPGPDRKRMVARTAPFATDSDETSSAAESSIDDGCFDTMSEGCVSLFAGDGVSGSRSRARRKPDLTEAQQLIVREMNRLSVKEREEAYEDVHGVSRDVEETQTLISQKLSELQMALDMVAPVEREAYDMARRMNSSYCDSSKFRLMFLRACRFDAHEAAARLVNHFQAKLKYFGPEKVGKDITLGDLSQDDLQTLSTGAFSIFPNCKDRAGRTIIFNLLRLTKYKHSDDSLRGIWWMVMRALQSDEQTQRRGMIIVAYLVGPNAMPHFNLEHRRKIVSLTKQIPYKITGVHFCYSDLDLRPALSAAQLAYHKNIYVRYRMHFGSDVECQYELLQYGIPAQILPMDSEGNLKRGVFLAQMERMKAIEEAQAEIDLLSFKKRSGASNGGGATKKAPQTITTVTQVTDNDVLFGRGKSVQIHPGNLRFLDVLDRYRAEYDSVENEHKKGISLRVIDDIHRSSGRFLKPNKDGTWRIATDSEAREKVSTAFRTKRHTQKKNAELGTMSNLAILP